MPALLTRPSIRWNLVCVWSTAAWHAAASSRKQILAQHLHMLVDPWERLRLVVPVMLVGINLDEHRESELTIAWPADSVPDMVAAVPKTFDLVNHA